MPTFNKIARLSVTASNHGNASQLNGKRLGKLYLFSNHPSTWQSQLKPPVNKKSLFDSFYHQNIRTNIDFLREFLLRFERIDLSIKNPERRKWIEEWVGNIINELLNYAISIQNLPAGWSRKDNIRLKMEHQYFLDPYRADEDFQAARKASDWLAAVCNDFARWLNHRLTGKDKKFTPQQEHRRMWTKLLEPSLRDHNEMIEADRKFQAKANS